MSKETAIQALKDLQNEIIERKKSLRPLFEGGLQELFTKHPTVKNLSVRINNHAFNDGDPTHFSLYYKDGLSVNFSDGVVISAYDGDEGDVTEQHEAIRKEFIKFFGEFDVDGFYETLYGDAYESLTFTCRDGKIKTS